MTGYKKMKTKILAVAILLFTSLTPMAWSHVITQSDLNQIRVGQTTEADLFQLFGAPTTRSVDLKHQVTLDWFRSKPMPWQAASSPIATMPVVCSAMSPSRRAAWVAMLTLSS